MVEKEKIALKCYLKTVEETLQELDTDRTGLTAQEAAQRIEQYGPNRIPSKKAITVWQVILRQFKSPLIYILLAAAVVSLAMGEYKDTIFILVVIVLNSGLGTYQEYKAEKSAQSLENYLKKWARVIRGGEEKGIDASQLVPGDIVLLQPGDKVPADLRLINANNLTVDQSILTGESTTVEKNIKTMADETATSDCANMVFAGTTVSSGRARGVVVATGLETEIGKIAEAVYAADDVKPPLLIRMDRFAKQIGFIVLAAAAVIAVVGLLQGYGYSEVFLLAIALAVSAIPEGLPIAVTVALSISTNRMAKRNVIVRKLAAVESLGSCTLIASDKTGTLTVNRQTVQKVISGSGKSYEVTGLGYNDQGHIEDANGLKTEQDEFISELAEACIMDNEASLQQDDGKWTHAGDPVEIALLSFAYKAGINPKHLRYKTSYLGGIPFESENKFSATVYQKDDKVKAVVKGAAEVVVPMAKQVWPQNPGQPYNQDKILDFVNQLTRQGYRVLAVATSDSINKDNYENLTLKDLGSLSLLAIIGFSDPLRPEVEEAVLKSQKAGIRVVMVTGDHPETALSIAQKLNIAQNMDKVLTGRQLKDLEEGQEISAELKEKIGQATVFARVSPIQKLNIVDLLRKAGNFVAVTGDGVNDAPALKKANIGVAMGSGTDVAKDTASIIVTDDSFASIVSGIEEGRFAYDNIRKVTYLLISTGAAEILIFMSALFMGLPLALVSIQILWLNLVTNGIQDIALAFEGGEPGAMARKPRDPNEGIFNRLMIEQTLISGISMAIITIGTWYYLMEKGYEISSARNLILMLMVLMQNIHVFNCRSESNSTFRVSLSRNYLLIGGVLAAQGIHLASLYIPFMQNLLGVSPITFTQWLLLFSLATIVLWVIETYKFVKRKIGAFS